MSGRVEGKVAIVVGAGQTPGATIGNGRATAILLAREGAQVVGADRDLASAEETVAMIAEEGGDALAVALLKIRGFTAEDFAMSHPSGSLGKRLILRVADVMRIDNAIPAVAPDVFLTDGLLEMTEKGLGMTAVVDAQGRIAGIFTDGDLRRALDDGVDVRTTRMKTIMHTHCKTITADVLAVEAVRVMEENKITSLLVSDAEQRLVGALNIHDLFRAGIM